MRCPSNVVFDTEYNHKLKHMLGMEHTIKIDIGENLVLSIVI